MNHGSFVLLYFPNAVLQKPQSTKSTVPAASPFQNLPVEVLVSIFDHCDLWTRINLSLTCRYLAQIANTSDSLVINGLNPSEQERRLISDPDFLPVKLMTARMEPVSYSHRLHMYPERVGCKHCKWRRRPDTDYLDPTKWWRYNVWTETIARNHFAPWVRSWGGIPTYGMIKLMLVGIRIMHEDFEKKQSRCGFLTLKLKPKLGS